MTCYACASVAYLQRYGHALIAESKSERCWHDSVVYHGLPASFDSSSSALKTVYDPEAGHLGPP